MVGGHSAKPSQPPHETMEWICMLYADVSLNQARLHAVHRHVAMGFDPVHFVSKQQVCKLGLPVGLKAVVGPLEIEVIEVYLSIAMGIRSDIDDTPIRSHRNVGIQNVC